MVWASTRRACGGAPPLPARCLSLRGGKCGDERRVCLRAWLHVGGGAAHSVVPTRFLLRWSIVRPRTVHLKVLHCQSGKRGETANHHSPDLYEPIIYRGFFYYIKEICKCVKFKFISSSKVQLAQVRCATALTWRNRGG